MARRKIPEFETPEETSIRKQLESISNHATRSEKTSWKRKHTNMMRLLEELAPLEEQILELEVAKQPIIDEIKMYRAEMVKTCVHPYDMLVLGEHYATCKFCNTKLKIVTTDG